MISHKIKIENMNPLSLIMISKKIKIENINPLSFERDSEYVIKKKLSGHDYGIIYASICEKKLITVDYNQIEIIWDLETDDMLYKNRTNIPKRLENCDKYLMTETKTCFHSNSTKTHSVYHTLYNSDIILSRLKDGKQQKLYGHKTTISYMEYLTDDILITSSLDKSIKIWNVNNGKCLLSLEHEEPVYRFCMDISKTKLVSWGQNGKDIYYWDISDYNLERKKLLMILYYKEIESPMHKLKLPFDIFKIIWRMSGLFIKNNENKNNGNRIF
jgi:WD40 repeat protein